MARLELEEMDIMVQVVAVGMGEVEVVIHPVELLEKSLAAVVVHSSLDMQDVEPSIVQQAQFCQYRT